MNIEEYREYCIRKPGVTEGFPFDSNTLVFKVMGKMFALADVELFRTINLKCDPDRAIQLRESYEGIKPGYHMNKQHWNTVDTDGSVGDKLLYELIDHSYTLIVDSLPKKLKEELANYE
ncbi:MmcQ/YjbR family DNA-binding protein [Imperialibacter roseus]|uniref:MmcQ/YjbR family DNA-binding protein n=1 Tax=Imperialibacter roseus TaxID=1324217 RepID=A0ABZ0IX81_9BACT|nr:MmcQ/YjbR family DNA-binding protein [Imperialibacter roseus]WOK09604.1 MmcQ/YjbR family DNA-binding protein [Imperialibacter roseus]